MLSHFPHINSVAKVLLQASSVSVVGNIFLIVQMLAASPVVSIHLKSIIAKFW